MIIKIVKSPLRLFSKSLANTAVVQLIEKDLDSAVVKKKNTQTQFLYQTYIVFLVAAWQDFIQALAGDAFEELHPFVPYSEAEQVAYEELLNAINRFNTPLTYHIDKLIQKATGIERISSHWHWKNMTNELARQRLAELLNIRHEIVHTGRSDQPPSFEINFEYTDFVYNLGCILNNVIVRHIKETTGRDSYSIESLKE